MKRLLVLLLLAGCGPYDVVVGEVPRNPDGSTPSPPGRPMPCETSDQCRSTDFCRKDACTDAIGRCAPRMGADPCG
ncbi:MAG: hypothetical protein JNK82_24805 [Myxococcaceae bacterium]|nr:hypothetical protein [Myxococcaceae bacterium]